MFQRRLYLTSEIYLEVSNRIHNEQDELMLTLFGPKTKTESVQHSIFLTDRNLETLQEILKDAGERDRSLPKA